MTHDERCTADTISKYYEVMEALTYEVSTMQFSEAIKDMPFIAKLVSVLMSAIAKVIQVSGHREKWLKGDLFILKLHCL